MTTSATMEQLLAKITRRFPGVQWTSARIEAGGWDNYAVILDDALVFRLPKSEAAPGHFRDEAALLDLVATHTTVRVPRVTHLSQDNTIMGCPYLAGDPLDAAFVEQFDSKLLGIVSEQLALFLSDLHEIAPEECEGRCATGRNPRDEAEWLRAGYLEHLRDCLPKEECRIIEQHIEDLESCLTSYTARVLLHGDLGLDHIILDREDNTISIIDFSDWGFGDPAFDFCGLCDSPRLLTEVFRRYRQKDRYGDLLARAKLYGKRIPVSLMIDSFRGYPCGFDESYQYFKRAFGIADAEN